MISNCLAIEHREHRPTPWDTLLPLLQDICLWVQTWLTTGRSRYRIPSAWTQATATAAAGSPVKENDDIITKAKIKIVPWWHALFCEVAWVLLGVKDQR